MERIKSVVVDGNSSTKRFCDNMHLSSANVDALNSSDDMCLFRGKLNADIIRLIRLKRVNPDVVTFLVSEYQSRIEEIVNKCRDNQSCIPAGLQRLME